MDTARIEALGAQPLAPALKAIRAAKSRSDIAALMGRNSRDFYGALFGIGLDIDVKDPTRYAVYVGQGGLGLPDRDYYIEESFAKQKGAYANYAAALLKAAGWPSPEKAASAILAFETEVAKASWSKTDQRDPDKTYNPISVDSLDPGAGLRLEAVQGAGLSGTRRVIVAGKSVPARRHLREDAGVHAPGVARVHVCDNAAPFLSSPFAKHRSSCAQDAQRPAGKPCAGSAASTLMRAATSAAATASTASATWAGRSATSTPRAGSRRRRRPQSSRWSTT
jgi:putative endopeptidase